MTRYHRVLATRGGMSYDALSFAELIGDVHWNRFTHQLKTIKGMDALSPLINLGTQHDGRSARTWMKRV